MNNNKDEIVLFENGELALEVNVSPQLETVWLSSNQMALLYGRDEKTIRKHVNKIFTDGELERESNTQKMRVAGVSQPVAFYNLDVIISVGYRVNSKQGIAFRKWANSILKQYIIQGYAVNANRMNQLGEVIRIMKRTENSLDAKQVLSVIEKYSLALDLLDDYDHQTMKRPDGNKAVYILSYEECRQVIDSMKFSTDSDLFGNEKDDSFKSSIGNIYQSFAGQDIYPTLEEKAANLLYFITTTINETKELIKKWKKDGKSIGLVPTMGFLHEGHASLIQKCREENDIVVVSDFVNPTQFGPNEDLEAYPRDFERDSQLCERIGADLIFCPSPEEMYHDPHAFVSIDLLSETLCGKTRPIHFKGVCTVVSKLFNIVTPDRAYFGQKDAQQLAIIRKMVLDLNFDIEIIGCPIIREEDGLAKSSRNTYLNTQERSAALCLSRAVRTGQQIIQTGMDAEQVLAAMRAVIEAEPLAKIDYISMVDALTMQPVERVDRNVLVAMAVYIGKTRLIDNFSYEVSL